MGLGLILPMISDFFCFFESKDELLWGATWLLRATHDVSYFNFIQSLGANDATDLFSWDNKYAGARVLLSRVNCQKETSGFSLSTHVDWG